METHPPYLSIVAGHPLARGDVFVVPLAMLHRPRSAEGASASLMEPTGTLSTGDFDGDIPDHIDSTTGHDPAEASP